MHEGNEWGLPVFFIFLWNETINWLLLISHVKKIDWTKSSMRNILFCITIAPCETLGLEISHRNFVGNVTKE